MIKKKWIMKICIIIVTMIIQQPLVSQTNELGLFFGGSLFHGDVGYQNAEHSIMNSKPALGLNLKRNINYHFSLNLSFINSEIYAHDQSTNDVFALNRNLHFKSKINELSILLEFNFKPFLSRDPDHNNSTYVFSGISKFFFNPQGQSADGTWHNLRPLATEGQDTDLYPTRELYELNGLAIPIGIGYKISVYEYITLSVNAGWRITFTDYMDDVSTTYVEKSLLSELGQELADPSNYNFDSGVQRGNPNNKDKFGFFGINIIYSIKDPKQECIDIIK